MSLVYSNLRVILISSIMNIAKIIGRIDDVDGVALKTDKWIEVFKKMQEIIYNTKL